MWVWAKATGWPISSKVIVFASLQARTCYTTLGMLCYIGQNCNLTIKLQTLCVSYVCKYDCFFYMWFECVGKLCDCDIYTYCGWSFNCLLKIGPGMLHLLISGAHSNHSQPMASLQSWSSFLPTGELEFTGHCHIVLALQGSVGFIFGCAKRNVVLCK